MTDTPSPLPALPAESHAAFEAEPDARTAAFFAVLGQPVPLCSQAALRQLETQAAATLPPHTLMARAGWAAAQFLRERLAHAEAGAAAQPVWIVVGPGNNGGDALVMATELHRTGVPEPRGKFVRAASERLACAH